MKHRRGRALVATDHKSCPTAALKVARSVVGHDGEVVLASIVVVPVTQPLDAQLSRTLEQACENLDKSEMAVTGAFDTRLVRSRGFARGVSETLDAEPDFDFVVIQQDKDHRQEDAAAHLAQRLEGTETTLVVVRPPWHPKAASAQG